MLKKILFTTIGLLFVSTTFSKDYIVSTKNTSLVFKAEKGSKSMFQYYGSKIDSISDIYNAGLNMQIETYPAFGLNTSHEKVVAITQPDGNMSLDLTVDNVKQNNDDNGTETVITLIDKIYPVEIKQIFKTYNNTDVISTWVEITNNGKKPITLYQFASAYLPVYRGENWINHMHGIWAAEHFMEEEMLTNGQKIITNKFALDNTKTDNPSFMISLDGKLNEKTGSVIGGTLAWTGNYKIKFTANNQNVTVTAGINEENSHYVLDGKKTFVTPEFAMTYSNSGKGGVSREFHRWARNYKLHQGNRLHEILLNSWEGVYFKVNQKEMNDMMEAFSSMGGELFVMDDGWFGNKYPRNDAKSSLGDWEVCKEKLPEGIEGLLESAQKNNIKFGIWIEPEMSNTKSELFEKHPDWIMRVPNRDLTTGRGGTQVVLDLTNPEVQDFAFSVVDNLMKNFPQIYYMKWDDNSSLMDYGSQYLPKDRQSHLYIDYQKGLENVLKRIRAKYPNLIMQACAGGGGRINYGILPYFDEFWTSDNTDAIQRIYMQWSISNYYPAIAMASHVSATKNHQTGRIVPIKYRFDVAMSGRLGMEIQPKDMTKEEKEFSKRAIKAYKNIRPIVQLGDLYRLISPYDNKGLASLMYVTPEKEKSVVFAYKLSHLIDMKLPYIKLDGLDADKFYKITDLTPNNEKKPCYLNGKIISGKTLMKQGLNVKKLMKNQYASLALELSVVK